MGEQNQTSLQIIFDTFFQLNMKNLLTEVEYLGIKISYRCLGPGICFIPPQGWFLLLNKDDLKNNKKRAELFYRIESMKLHHSNAIIGFIGYHRLGTLKRYLVREKTVRLLSLNQTPPIIHGFIPFRHDKDAAICLKSCAKREQIEDNPPTTSRQKSKAKTIGDLQVTFIEGLFNCGEKKAEELLLALGSPQKIIDALLYHPEQITTIKGFGPKFVEQNRRLLCDFLPDSL